VIQPVREVLVRGICEGALRAHLPGDTVFEMVSALPERALRLTIADATTLGAAAEAVVTLFLDGARAAS
jgi:TetR/AcrR family transcriptional repressor of mexCD-oprJ operon